MSRKDLFPDEPPIEVAIAEAVTDYFSFMRAKGEALKLNVPKTAKLYAESSEGFKELVVDGGLDPEVVYQSFIDNHKK